MADLVYGDLNDLSEKLAFLSDSVSNYIEPRCSINSCTEGAIYGCPAGVRFCQQHTNQHQHSYGCPLYSLKTPLAAGQRMLLEHNLHVLTEFYQRAWTEVTETANGMVSDYMAKASEWKQWAANHLQKLNQFRREAGGLMKHFIQTSTIFDNQSQFSVFLNIECTQVTVPPSNLIKKFLEQKGQSVLPQSVSVSQPVLQNPPYQQSVLPNPPSQPLFPQYSPDSLQQNLHEVGIRGPNLQTASSMTYQQRNPVIHGPAPQFATERIRPQPRDPPGPQ